MSKTKTESMVQCGKCKGTGIYHFNNGMTGICYSCNGKGYLKKISNMIWQAYIVMEKGGNPKAWIGVNAESQKDALKKAKKIALKGCYKDFTDSIKVEPREVEYNYKSF